MDAHGENDKTFNNLLTAVDDFNNELHFNNNFAVAGEIAAGGSYIDLVKLDASNIVQLGQATYEVRVPADPTNALGVATKQYVDNTLMKGLIAKVRATTTSQVNADVVNISAVGRVIYIYQQSAVSADGLSTLTLDGTAYAELTSVGTGNTSYQLNRVSTDAVTFAMGGSEDIKVHFKTSLRLQHRNVGGVGSVATVLLYERN